MNWLVTALNKYPQPTRRRRFAIVELFHQQHSACRYINVKKLNNTFQMKKIQSNILAKNNYL